MSDMKTDGHGIDDLAGVRSVPRMPLVRRICRIVRPREDDPNPRLGIERTLDPKYRFAVEPIPSEARQFFVFPNPRQALFRDFYFSRFLFHVSFQADAPKRSAYSRTRCITSGRSA